MNTKSVDFKFIADNDHTPLAVFDAGGRIIYLNYSAEILFSYVDTKEIFDTAMLYTGKEFGSKTTLADIRFKHFSFYAINVCYNSDEWVALRLYCKPAEKDVRVDRSKLRKTDINLLLSASLSMFEMKYEKKLTLLADQEIPEFKIDQNGFAMLMNKTMELFRESGEIRVSVTIALGESVIMEGRKHHLVRLRITGDKPILQKSEDIVSAAKKQGIVCIPEKNEIVFDIPVIE